MFNRYATNAKRASEKKMFDADRARKRLDKGSKNWKGTREPIISPERLRRMKTALKGFNPVFKPQTKGG